MAELKAPEIPERKLGPVSPTTGMPHLSEAESEEDVGRARKKRKLARESRDSLASSNSSAYYKHEAEIYEAEIEEKLAKIKRHSSIHDKALPNQEDDPQESNDSYMERLHSQITELENKREEALKQKAQFERNLLALAAQSEASVESLDFDQSTSAFIEIILSEFGTGLKKRKYDDQLSFKLNLITYYNAAQDVEASAVEHMHRKQLHDFYRTRPIHCPITRAYASYDVRTAAHIVPHRMGQTIMNLLFGEHDGNSPMSNRNGLLLHPHFETMYDNHLITIVPCSEDENETEFKVRLMLHDEGFLKTPIEHMGNLEYRYLQDRKLVFTNNKRPARRYLYFMYCIALLQAKTNHRVRTLNEELKYSKNIWATPGKWIPANMLGKVAAAVGHDYASLMHLRDHEASPTPASKKELEAYNEGIEQMMED